MTPFIAEIIGTMVLLLFGSGVVAGCVLKQSKAENAGWVVITLGWGLAVTLGIYASGNVSGAHLNPAVTIGLASIGQFPWAQVPGYILAQFIGAMLGSGIVWAAYYVHWEKTDDKGAKLAVFSTGPAVRNLPANLLTEAIGTAILVFAILFIGTNNIADGLGPIVVGLLIVALGMSFGGPTGYAINPARDLGPRIMHAILPIPGKGDSDWSYAWVPVVGPIIGGVIGALAFAMLY
ncbi:MAG: glycerol uptake facilitator protein [Peptostreptococcaceae bacterium]|nr:glycerol uptake facilitator protein [Peptostreptococcaceae bacterium]